jgi:hypothetical protein
MRIAIAKTPIEHKLFALQAEWDRSGPLAREAIAQQIKDNPTWNLTVDARGPIPRTTTQEPQNKAILTENRGLE